MHTQIHVNLPVADLARSKAFFEALGYGFDARFTDEKAACLVLGENLYAMLLRRDFFAGFTGASRWSNTASWCSTTSRTRMGTSGSWWRQAAPAA